MPQLLRCVRLHPHTGRHGSGNAEQKHAHRTPHMNITHNGIPESASQTPTNTALKRTRTRATHLARCRRGLNIPYSQTHHICSFPTAPVHMRRRLRGFWESSTCPFRMSTLAPRTFLHTHTHTHTHTVGRRCNVRFRGTMQRPMTRKLARRMWIARIGKPTAHT